MTWQETEADIIALLRQSSALQAELKDCQEKAANEKQKMLLYLARILDAFDRVFDNIGPKEKDADRQTKIWLGNFRSIRRPPLRGGAGGKRGRRSQHRGGGGERGVVGGRRCWETRLGKDAKN